MDVLLKISIVLFVGFIGGRIAKLFKLPNVSGYLVVGLFLGPSFFNLVNEVDSESFTIISELALGIIAFGIGSEFLIKDMLKLGKTIAIITVAEVIGALSVVFLVLFYIFKVDFATSVVLASMSVATAPAATVMVIQQYKAYGPLTKTILPVVALDDILGIIVFGIGMSLAKISLGGTTGSKAFMFLEPVIEIAGSLLVGFLLGALLVFITKRAKASDEVQVIALAAIGIATGLSVMLGISPLLTNIFMGATLVNLKRKPKRIFGAVEKFVSPIYVLFFTLAGASLNLNILKDVGLMGVAYVIARAAGKIIGAYLGAQAVDSEPAVKKYLGFTLLPQGGISIGLSVIVRQELPADIAGVITTIIMFSILIYEVSGPIFAKMAIKGAGEFDGLEKEQAAKKAMKQPAIETIEK